MEPLEAGASAEGPKARRCEFFFNTLCKRYAFMKRFVKALWEQQLLWSRINKASLHVVISRRYFTKALVHILKRTLQLRNEMLPFMQMLQIWKRR